MHLILIFITATLSVIAYFIFKYGVIFISFYIARQQFSLALWMNLTLNMTFRISLDRILSSLWLHLALVLDSGHKVPDSKNNQHRRRLLSTLYQSHVDGNLVTKLFGKYLYRSSLITDQMNISKTNSILVVINIKQLCIFLSAKFINNLF